MTRGEEPEVGFYFRVRVEQVWVEGLGWCLVVPWQEVLKEFFSVGEEVLVIVRKAKKG